MSILDDHVGWQTCDRQHPDAPSRRSRAAENDLARFFEGSMMDIHVVQQQIVQFLTQRGHRETCVLAQTYLIADGRVAGLQTVFAQASAVWLFEETYVRIDDQDGRVLMTIGAADAVKNAA
jgi:hypothetical protein